MAWNNDPKVRDLGRYADKHGFSEAVIVGINRQTEQFEVLSYGKTAALCKDTKVWADRIFEAIKSGKIEV